MLVPSLTLPRHTSHTFVDPLEDFVHPKGPFVKTFGWEDVEPVAESVRQMSLMTEAFHGEAVRILCRSLYKENQWPEKGLEQLCTTKQGRQSVIPMEQFDVEICKTHNSLLTATFPLEEFLGDDEYFGIAGLTLTSCVKATIKDCRELFAQSGKNRKIVVALNAVAARKSQRAKADALIDELSQPDVKDVLVVRDWQSIKHQ
jgi:hypothetical protein